MITDFVRIRRDGKRMVEHMDVRAMLALGWRPDQVVRIEWAADGATYALDAACGMLAKVAPDRTAIALLDESEVRGGAGSTLSIVNADGTLRHRISHTHTINGEPITGHFVWFEPPLRDPDQCVGAIFLADGKTGSVQYQFDVDVATGEVGHIRALR